MDIRVEQQLALYNEAAEDKIFTPEEKAKLEKAGITEELQKKLNNKTQQEMRDILEINLSQESSITKTELSCGKKIWNVANKILGGIAGGIAGLYVGSRMSNPVRNTKIGGVLGLGVGIVLGALTNFNKGRNITSKSDLSKKYSQDDFMNTLPACTDTIHENENLTVICKRNHVRKSLVLKANPEIKDENKLQIDQVITIPERRIIKPGSITNIDQVSIASQVPKNYINDIIFGLEGRHKEPDLKPYYDKVKDDAHPNGHLTIGFGHTGEVRGELMTDKNKDKIEISFEEAHEILTQDLLNARKAAMEYLGEENFNKAPQSIQNALIDIAFNKGIELGYQGTEVLSNGKIRKFKTPTQKIKKNLEKGDYVSVAKNVIYETDNEGLKKRNVYRIILATRDLSETERNAVLDATEAYYQKVLTDLKKYPKDVKALEEAWQNARKGICEGFFD